MDELKPEVKAHLQAMWIKANADAWKAVEIAEIGMDTIDEHAAATIFAEAITCAGAEYFPAE